MKPAHTLKATWGPPDLPIGDIRYAGQSQPHPGSLGAASGSHTHQPSGITRAGSRQQRLPAALPSPAGPAGPGTLRQDAAEARGSLPAGRQAGRRADLDGAQQWASCQAAPAPPAQPALPSTDTSAPSRRRRGPRSRPCRAGLPPQPGPRRDPHRLPPAHSPAMGTSQRPPTARTTTRYCRKQTRQRREESQRCQTPLPLWAPRPRCAEGCQDSIGAAARP